MKMLLHEPPREQARRSTTPGRKLFYRIQEVSKLTGIKPYVLRYWESEFRELSPAKDASDQRRYRQGDIEVVLAIRKLLYEDRFTIEGARKRLRDELRSMRDDEETRPLAEVVPVTTLVEQEAAPAPALTEFPVQLQRGPVALSTPVMMDSQPEPNPRLERTLISLRAEVNALLEMLA